MKKAVFVLLDEFSDWEGSYLLPYINQNPEWEIKIASNKEDIRSIGGMTLKRDLSLEEIPKNLDLLILIGGNSWNKDRPDLTAVIETCLKNNVLVGAICGAVDYLARNGLLQGYSHTGNAQFFWNDFEKYTNPTDYLEQQVVTSGNLITANGTATLDFTSHVLSSLEISTKEENEKYINLHKLGYYDFVDTFGNPYF